MSPANCKGRRDSSRYHPVYLMKKKQKKAATKGRIFRGTTLLHQINSQPLNVSHSGNAYCYFSKAVRERTSTSCPHRFSPSIGSLRRVRKFTFFRQHF